MINRTTLRYFSISMMLLLACVRFVHLQADFPIGIGASDMPYTDEGWWSRNAIAFVKTGSWYIDDGYNIVNSLPVLPVLQVVWFSVFGISLSAARALTAVCSLLLSFVIYKIVRREVDTDLAWTAPFIVLSSYPIFAYSRLALLELPMLLLLVISLWQALDSHRQPVLKTVSAGFFFR